MKLRRFTDADFEIVSRTATQLSWSLRDQLKRQMEAARNRLGVETVTLNGQPFTRAAKMSHHW